MINQNQNQNQKQTPITTQYNQKITHAEQTHRNQSKIAQTTITSEEIKRISSVAVPIIIQNIFAPLEFLTIRFQLMNQMIRSKSLQKKYGSYLDSIKRIVKQENGIMAFYKGNLAYSLFIWSQLSYTLQVTEKAKEISNQFLKQNRLEQHQLFKFGNFLPYLIYGVGGIMFHPLEYVRIRLMADKASDLRGGNKQFKGILNVLNSTKKGDGIRGIFRGVWISYIGKLMHRGIFFGLNQALTSYIQDAGIQTKIVISTFSYLLANFFTYPIDTIRKRMMMRSLQAETYNTSISCVSYIRKNQKFISGLYGGFGLNLFRSLAGGLFFLAVSENAKKSTCSQNSQNLLNNISNPSHESQHI